MKKPLLNDFRRMAYATLTAAGISFIPQSTLAQTPAPSPIENFTQSAMDACIEKTVPEPPFSDDRYTVISSTAKIQNMTCSLESTKFKNSEEKSRRCLFFARTDHPWKHDDYESFPMIDLSEDNRVHIEYMTSFNSNAYIIIELDPNNKIPRAGKNVFSDSSISEEEKIIGYTIPEDVLKLAERTRALRKKCFPSLTS